MHDTVHSARCRDACKSSQQSSTLRGPPANAWYHSQRPSTRGQASSWQLSQSRNRTQLQCARLPEAIEGSVSLYAISDLHTDHHANMAWVQGLPSYKSTSSKLTDTSVLLVAGDISDDIIVLRATLEALVSKFDLVSFVPGNHELWVKGHPGSPEALARNGGATDSIDKLSKVLDLCRDLGVLRQPAQIGGLLLVPLLAWHHQSWDKEADIPGIPRASAMTIADYAACIWPDWLPDGNVLGSDEVAAWFDAANETIQQPGWNHLQGSLQYGNRKIHNNWRNHSGAAAGDVQQQRRQRQQRQQRQRHFDVVSFSHFLPHQDLLPEKRFLSYPNLAKAVGSDYLWSRLEQLQPDMHIFGHSHFAWDATTHGIRCIQAPLCYPNERRHRIKSIILQNTPHSSSSSGSLQQQQQQQQQETKDHDQEAHVNNVPWLPVRIYRAKYTAQLVPAAAAAAAAADQQQHGQLSSSSSAECASLLRQHGLPVLYTNQLHVQQQQGDSILAQSLAAADSANPSSSSSSSGGCYLITDWQSSWTPNLFGVWSEYYKATPREPDIVSLAPWVAKRYLKYPRLAQRMARLLNLCPTNNVTCQCLQLGASLANLALNKRFGIITNECHSLAASFTQECQFSIGHQDLSAYLHLSYGDGTECRFGGDRG